MITSKADCYVPTSTVMLISPEGSEKREMNLRYARGPSSNETGNISFWESQRAGLISFGVSLKLYMPTPLSKIKNNSGPIDVSFV